MRRHAGFASGPAAKRARSRAASTAWAAHGAEADAELAAEAREVADVTGAGDTVIATMTLALAAGAAARRRRAAGQSRRRDRRREVRPGDGHAWRVGRGLKGSRKVLARFFQVLGVLHGSTRFYRVRQVLRSSSVNPRRTVWNPNSVEPFEPVELSRTL